MESERIKERREKRRLRKKRRIITLVSVIALCISGYILANNQFVRSLYYKTADPISDKNVVFEFEEGISAEYFVFDNTIISSSKNGVYAYNLSGEKVYEKHFEELSSLIANYTDLKMKSCDKYIVAYDAKGRDAVVFNTKKIVSKVKSNSSILLAKPLNNGGLILLAEDNSAKNQVIIYNNTGSEEFIWHSGINNIVDAAYSYKENKLAIATADLSTGILNTRLKFFDITSNEPFGEMLIENVFITNINYYNDNMMLAISDNGLYYINSDGEIKRQYSYNNKMLSNYKLMNNGYIALSFVSNSNETITEIVTNKGKLLGSYTSLNEVSSMDFANGSVLLCENRKISILTKRGFLLREIEYNKDLKKAFFIGKNKIILISNSELRIIN